MQMKQNRQTKGVELTSKWAIIIIVLVVASIGGGGFVLNTIYNHQDEQTVHQAVTAHLREVSEEEYARAVREWNANAPESGVAVCVRLMLLSLGMGMVIGIMLCNNRKGEGA